MNNLQGLPFRGHEENVAENDNSNKGNYIALQNLLSKYDSSVQKMMEKRSEKPGSVTLGLKTIMEELIKITGRKLMESITTEIKSSVFYVIIADEITVFNG